MVHSLIEAYGLLNHMRCVRECENESVWESERVWECPDLFVLEVVVCYHFGISLFGYRLKTVLLLFLIISFRNINISLIKFGVCACSV